MFLCLGAAGWGVATCQVACGGPHQHRQVTAALIGTVFGAIRLAGALKISCAPSWTSCGAIAADVADRLQSMGELVRHSAFAQVFFCETFLTIDVARHR